MKELFNKLSNVCRFLSEKRFVYEKAAPVEQVFDDENPLEQAAEEKKDSGAIKGAPITREEYLKAHKLTIAAGNAIKGKGLKKIKQFAPEERQSDFLADARVKPGKTLKTLDDILADVGKLESRPDISGRKYASKVGPDAAIDELIDAAMPGVHPKGVTLSKQQEQELDRMIDRGLKEREEEPLVLSDAQQKEATEYLIKSIFEKTKPTESDIASARAALKKRPDYTALLATALAFKDRGSQEEKNNFIKYTAQEVVAYEPTLASVLGIEYDQEFASALGIKQEAGGDASRTAVAEIHKEGPEQPKAKPQPIKLAKEVNAPQKPKKKQPLPQIPQISDDPLKGIDGPSIIRTPSPESLARQGAGRTTQERANRSFEKWMAEGRNLTEEQKFAAKTPGEQWDIIIGEFIPQGKKWAELSPQVRAKVVRKYVENRMPDMDFNDEAIAKIAVAKNPKQFRELLADASLDMQLAKPQEAIVTRPKAGNAKPEKK